MVHGKWTACYWEYCPKGAIAPLAKRNITSGWFRYNLLPLNCMWQWTGGGTFIGIGIFQTTIEPWIFLFSSFIFRFSVKSTRTLWSRKLLTWTLLVRFFPSLHINCGISCHGTRTRTLLWSVHSFGGNSNAILTFGSCFFFGFYCSAPRFVCCEDSH